MDYREYEIEEDGAVYVVREYENGTTVKVIKGDGEASPPDETLDEMTQMQLEMAANVEYAVQILEMSMEG